MTAQVPIEVRSTKKANTGRRFAIGLLLAVLLYRAVLFAAAGVDAIRYPWELDYGEGIVWQQMRWIFTSRAYGPIDGFPAIVFHYPPLYHAMTSIVAGALRTDELATGRAISVLSTFAAAIASGILGDFLLRDRTDQVNRRLCSSIAALLVFTYVPVVYWATFMRVDMLAIALGMFGLVAAFKSAERPRLIYLASLLFVGAVYTRQTALAAPAATFGVLIFARPKLALRGIATCLVLGTAILVTLGWLTDGGFYRHIFLYNINRFEADRLWRIAYVAAAQAIYIALAGFVLVRRFADLRSRYRVIGNARAALGAEPADIRLLIAAAYLMFSALMVVLVAKSGSNINYFLDCFFALGLFAAMAPAEAESGFRARKELGKLLGLAVPAGLAIGAYFAPLPRTDERADDSHARELTRLAQVIASADKPVISDDMVLLIRGGQDVRWESAIFAELASSGRWDDRPFVDRMRRHEFAFFITLNDRRRPSFAQRYSPRIAAAMDSEYPVRDEMAGLIIHRPRNGANG